MELPLLIQKLYGVSDIVFTGLYSFEFLDKKGNTITEIFFMVPPTGKSVSESTRSSTVPTLGGNYNIDGGNATKEITLNGELYFPYRGNPDNPSATNIDSTSLENPINGLEEYLKLRWMLIRYRDYTLSSKGRMTIPTALGVASPGVVKLYKKVSNNIKDKIGALYDEVQVVFHDYDMSDHFFCRVDNFSSQQSASKYLAIEYTISIECYEPYKKRTKSSARQTKLTPSAGVDSINTELQNINYDDSLETIQNEISYNSLLLSAANAISTVIADIDAENEEIQSGKSSPLSKIPEYITNLQSYTDAAKEQFLNTFLSPEQKTLYESGDILLEEVVNIALFAFFNTLQKVSIQADSMNGVIVSTPNFETIRYATDTNIYTLTEEQFDDDDATEIQADISFRYYTVLEGDTSRIIASRELNDPEKFIDILKINNITENDFIDGTIVGENIKIPIESSVLSRGDENLVFEANYDDLEKFLYGTDLKLNLNDDFVISSTNDFTPLEGIENVYENIESRVTNLKGSLNVFNPDWGTIPVDYDNVPLLVKIDKHIEDLTEQIQSDPRVETVEMILDKLDWNGERLSTYSRVFFVGSEDSREVAT